MSAGEDVTAVGRARQDKPPIYGSWLVFFLVFTPHLAAAGAAIGYLSGGPSVLHVEQPADGTPVRELGIDDKVGGALLYLFPYLTLGCVLLSFGRLAQPYLARRIRFPYAVWVPSLSPQPAVLAFSGWGVLACCVLLDVTDGWGGDVFSGVALSPLGWFESREGRGLVLLASGLALGFALAAVGLWLDCRPVRRRKG
jgi:hypothetical protein